MGVGLIKDIAKWLCCVDILDKFCKNKMPVLLYCFLLGILFLVLNCSIDCTSTNSLVTVPF